MKLVTFELCGRDRVGAVLDGRLIDLNTAFTGALMEAGETDPAATADRILPPEMLGFLQGGDEAVAAARRALQYAVDLKYDLPGAVPCLAGGRWEWDGVVFELLHPGAAIIVSNAAQAHTGSGVAWLGGYINGTDRIYQYFAVPAGASPVTLRYWYRITTAEVTPGAWDFLEVQVLNPSSGAVLATVASYSNSERGRLDPEPRVRPERLRGADAPPALHRHERLLPTRPRSSSTTSPSRRRRRAAVARPTTRASGTTSRPRARLAGASTSRTRAASSSPRSSPTIRAAHPCGW